MKLLICNPYKIDPYQLPDKIEDFYMINYSCMDNTLVETITLEAEEGRWKLRSDENMKLFLSGKMVERAFLMEYVNYKIQFDDLEFPIYLQMVPDLESFGEISIQDISTITIGCSSTCNINYQNQETLLNHAIINLKDHNNNYTIKGNSDGGAVYVNLKRVNEKDLQLGDVIFINGLKIIWMNNYIKVNNPNQKVTIMGLNIVNLNNGYNNNYTPITETERNRKLYNDSQLFFHTPRLKSEIKVENIKFDLPPEKQRDEQMPIILTIGSSSIIGITSCFTGISAAHGLINGEITLFNAMLEFTMCILMLIACIGFPLLTDIWQKRRVKKKEKLRQTKYREYLSKKVEYIKKIIKKQEQILMENNIPLKEIQKKIIGHSNSIWSREIIDSDFLMIDLGVGDILASIEIEALTDQFSLYDDNLKEEVLKIVNEKRMLKNVPITHSMVQNKVTPFILNCNFKQDYINSIMLQLVFYYSGADLKIVLFTNEMNKDNWNYLKYLPHCWSKDRQRRFFSTNENEMSQLSVYLEQEYDKRMHASGSQDQHETHDITKLYKNYSEYYLIITDDFKAIKNLSIINKLLNSNANVGFSLMILESSIKNIPSRLTKFIDIGNNRSGIFSRNQEMGEQIQFSPEYLTSLDISEYSKYLANIPVFAKNINSLIPQSLTFLDMYHVGRVDHLNVISRWENNDPTVGLHAPVGVKENEKLIELDLHEKFHGPHGLIAGTTGSGKSEFIITYILSMALNYHPDEVQFILIDYKGGGLAGAFENRETGVKIPHLVGTITNLDIAEMNRTLVSIKSELQRRQMKFNETREKLDEGTIDIYKYQRLYREGKVKEPMAHLFVISDEFAELKDQQPDFMDELISTARIGRSLGIHLILATQKPSGVVNDQIWSNSRFKVCLKVQTSEDSIELLKKPDAANIKETGRFYLQVGNDEIFELGQSAWTGAKYIPVDRIQKKIDDHIEFISNDGSVLKSINDVVKNDEVMDQGEQLTNIVKYLYDLAIREKIKFRSLWLPSLPNELYLANVIKKYNYQPDAFIMDIPIGEYDKPTKQLQDLYSVNLTSKNTVIYGLPGSGKELFITTLIYSACIYHTVGEINFYILDFGSESLMVFKKMPHVGDVITSSEKEKVLAQFQVLEKEIRRRKELFADYAGDYFSYCKKSGNTVPLIVTVLNAYESFMETCGDYDSYLFHLLREGSKYGIVFVTSAVSTNSIRTNVLECFANKIILQTADSFDYQYILGAENGFTPKKTFGRGLAIVNDETCEFQIAYITEKDNINMTIKQMGRYLMDYYRYKVKEIKILPKYVTLKEMLKYTKDIKAVPIGISRDDVEKIFINFMANPTTLILGNSVIEDLTFMCGIIDLIDSIKSVHLNILDFLSCVNTDGEASYYNIHFNEIFEEILKDQADIPTINILLGIGSVQDILSNEEMSMFYLIMNNIGSFKNNYFIIIDDYSNFKKIEIYDWYHKLNKNFGIWVGANIDEQDVFKIDHLNNYDLEENLKDIIFIINHNNYIVGIGIGNEVGQYNG